LHVVASSMAGGQSPLVPGIVTIRQNTADHRFMQRERMSEGIVTAAVAGHVTLRCAHGISTDRHEAACDKMVPPGSARTV
ncbi:MAG: hypothetical protein OXE76_11870, partial [Alphaproteobacteria bacterium]|nr:hypothetical protein [Alphaproteobacteria bacterium]